MGYFLWAVIGPPELTCPWAWTRRARQGPTCYKVRYNGGHGEHDEASVQIRETQSLPFDPIFGVGRVCEVDGAGV